MCVIIDANQLGDFVNITSPGMTLLREWVENRGKVVYSTSGKYAREIRRHDRARKKLEEYVRRGNAKIFDGETCENAAREFDNYDINSNDAHILGLAKVAGATLLCTDDRMLMRDFKEHISNGKVYPPRRADQEKVLRERTCP